MGSEALFKRWEDGVPFPRGTGGKMFSQTDVRINDGHIHRVRESPVEGVHVPLGDL